VAGRIPQTFIDDLLNRIDIVDIIDHDVPLKKTGRDYSALCPFHTEKSPSFTVSQEKQFYHCFGCGAHGSAFGFLMNHRGLSFVEAIEEAAHSVGLEVPHEGPLTATKTDYSPLYDTLDRAQQFFVQQLKTHPDRDRAVDETGHQIAVFGRLGSRPFTLEEMRRLYLDKDGKPAEGYGKTAAVRTIRFKVLLADGKEVSGLLPPGVLDYINAEGLYGC